MLAAVLLGSAALAVLCKRRIEECIPVLLLGVITALYLFYCLNILIVGKYVIYAAFLVLLVLAVVRIGKKRKLAGSDCGEEHQGRSADASLFCSEEDLHSDQSKATDMWGTEDPAVSGSASVERKGLVSSELSRIITPALLLFVALSIIFLIFAAGLKPSVWDELRLWAAMPKALHATGALQVGEGSLLYSTMQSYPPGIALLSFFFTSLSGSYSYGSTFAVYWIFAASLVLPALRNMKWKQWYLLPAVGFVILLVPYLLTVNGASASGDWNYYYVSLYIEPVLGCLMGYAFFQAVKGPFGSGFSLAQFALTLFVLPTLKNVGALYACMAFAAAVVIYLAERRRNATQNLFSDSVSYSRNKTRDDVSAAYAGGSSVQNPPKSAITGEKTGVRILKILLPIAETAVSYFSWQLIIHTRGTGEFIDFKLNDFTGEKLVSALNGMLTWGKIPFFYYILFFLLIDVLLTFVIKDIAKRSALIGAAGIAVTFLIFFYGYVSHYGLMLSSLHRYTSVFTFACFMYLLMRSCSRIGKREADVDAARAATIRSGVSGELYTSNVKSEQAESEHAASDQQNGVATEHPESERWNGAETEHASSVQLNGAETEHASSEQSNGAETELAASERLHGPEVAKSSDGKIGKTLLFIAGVILMVGSVFLMVHSKSLQLQNKNWKDAGIIIKNAEQQISAMEQNAQNSEKQIPDMDQIAENGDKHTSTPELASAPAICYLALGGDTRKQSQRHETLALEAIGSSVNIQNIWCDKLYNEPVDGVITDQEEMTRIWAKNLKSGRYQYVIVSDPDEDIRYAVKKLAEEPEEAQDGDVYRIKSADTAYGIILSKK